MQVISLTEYIVENVLNTHSLPKTINQIGFKPQLALCNCNDVKSVRGGVLVTLVEKHLLKRTASYTKEKSHFSLNCTKIL